MDNIKVNPIGQFIGSGQILPELERFIHIF
jgi:hypothetical protein